MHELELLFMPYNNSDMGEISKVIVISSYSQHSQEYKPSPPPGAFHLIDDSGIDLVDDSGDYLITP